MAGENSCAVEVRLGVPAWKGQHLYLPSRMQRLVKVASSLPKVSSSTASSPEGGHRSHGCQLFLNQYRNRLPQQSHQQCPLNPTSSLPLFTRQRSPRGKFSFAPERPIVPDNPQMVSYPSCVRPKLLQASGVAWRHISSASVSAVFPMHH